MISFLKNKIGSDYLCTAQLNSSHQTQIIERSSFNFKTQIRSDILLVSFNLPLEINEYPTY